jgi:hypothetical protein
LPPQRITIYTQDVRISTQEEDWQGHVRREESRWRDGNERLPDEADARQRQLTRTANAAYGAALARLMARDGDAAGWFTRAAEAYRTSWDDAPPGSWGRPIGALKARVLARDEAGAAADAEWALGTGAADAESPIGRYAATLALLVLDRREEARDLAETLRTADGFPRAVGDALVYLAAEDPLGYDEAVATVLESFEQREEYLEDVPVADTVLVLQSLAARRGMAVVDLESPLLPSK